MKLLRFDTHSDEQIRAALRSEPPGGDSEVAGVVARIIADVRERGDVALLELGRKFDSPALETLRVLPEEFEQAYELVDARLLAAIRQAKASIEDYHKRQVLQSWDETIGGKRYGQIIRPIERVGFYAPGGLAPYPSTVLMAAVPGLVAGVKQLVMCCPAQKDGNVHPAMLVAAAECGVKDVFKIGGAQAVAAMAFGVGSVPKVDKIVGPGNAYVSEAKRQLYGVVGIDSLAGPSEILVLADETAPAKYVAADMLSQAEHAKDSRCAFVTDCERLMGEVQAEIEKQLSDAARVDCARASLDEFGLMVLAKDMAQGIEYANEFASEHLEIMTSDPWAVMKSIRNAGTIMVGAQTPVPICDFGAGPNHTLPTSGTARFASALSVDDYIHKSAFLCCDRSGLEALAPSVLALAEAEGFQAHARTVTIRLEDHTSGGR